MQGIYGVYGKVGDKTVLRNGVLNCHSRLYRTSFHSNLSVQELLKRYRRNVVSHPHIFHTYIHVSLVYFQKSHT